MSTATKSPKVAGPKFVAKMSVLDARAVLISATRGVNAGGFTQRAGMLLRDLIGAKFGSYVPSDAIEVMRRKDFVDRFTEATELWVKGWDPKVTPETQAMREKQAVACRAFLKDKGWERVADAIESLIAHRAGQVVMEDASGNKRIHTIVDILDLMFGIRLTAARAAGLRVTAVG